MRWIIATSLALLTGCQPSHDEAASAADSTQEEIFRQADAKQSLSAFGGTVIGKDQGEWGGEVSFHEPDGRTYTVIDDNSHGIFEMPYGVIALTGLAHLGINRGEVHLLSRSSDGLVSSTSLMRLPGMPCDVLKVGNHITMRIPSGQKKLPGGVLTSSYSCYVLASDKTLSQYKCPIPEPDFCVG